MEGYTRTGLIIGLWSKSDWSLFFVHLWASTARDFGFLRGVSIRGIGTFEHGLIHGSGFATGL